MANTPYNWTNFPYPKTGTNCQGPYSHGRYHQIEDAVPLDSLPDFDIRRLSASGSLVVGGILRTISPGQSVLAYDDFRFIWSVDGGKVLYSSSRDGRLYLQSHRGFISQMDTETVTASFVKKISEVELELLKGIIAGSSFIGFALIVGIEVTQFLRDNREQNEKLIKQLEAFLVVKIILRRNTPTIHDVVCDAVLRMIYKDMKDTLADALKSLPHEKSAAFGVGVVIGNVGNKLAKGKLSPLGVLYFIVRQILFRYVATALPEELKKMKEGFEQLKGQAMQLDIDTIVKQAREAGINLQEDDAEQMIKEAIQHPREMKEVYEILKEAFEDQN